MLQNLRNHFHNSAPATLASLGPLETCVLGILWLEGEVAVRDVCQKLEQTLAYTTVMTTLDRLYKKGLLMRRKQDRAYFYEARFSRLEMESRGAIAMVSGFLAKTSQSGELLISCLVDAVSEQDENLLDELEKKIRLKREELNRARNLT